MLNPRHLTPLLVLMSGMGLSGLSASDPASAVIIPQASSPWSFSVGVVARSVGADFILNKPSPLNTSGIFSQLGSSGLGDVGLFKGGLGVLKYDDGQIGPEGFPLGAPYVDDGTTTGQVNSASQVSGPTGRFDGTSPIEEWAFHSSLQSFAYQTGFENRSAQVSDTDSGLGPYVQLRYPLANQAGLLINLVTGYSWVNTDHTSGAQALAQQSITENGRDQRFTYIYDHSTDNGATGPFPYYDGDSYTVFDAAKFNAFYPGSTAIDPRRAASESESSRIAARFYALGSADLDVNLHEIPFGVEVGRQLGQLQVLLTAGPTLNVIDFELTSQLNWYQQGRSSAVASETWRDDGNAMKVGVFGGLVARYPLTSDGRLYLEAQASYRWVDSVDASAGFADVTIDPSSWEGGFGLGFSF